MKGPKIPFNSFVMKNLQNYFHGSFTTSEDWFVFASISICQLHVTHVVGSNLTSFQKLSIKAFSFGFRHWENSEIVLYDKLSKKCFQLFTARRLSWKISIKLFPTSTQIHQKNESNKPSSKQRCVRNGNKSPELLRAAYICMKTKALMFADEIKKRSHLISLHNLQQNFSFFFSEENRVIFKTAYLINRNLQKASNDAIKHLKNIFPGGGYKLETFWNLIT